MYVTDRISPDTTERSPGLENAFSENRVPTTPLLAEPLVRKAPPTVPVALMENEATDELLVTTEGLAFVAAVKDAATRVELLYPVN